MTEESIQEYYEMLKYFYTKPESDRTDKAKSIKTVAHVFYNVIRGRSAPFAEAMKEFYKWNKYNEASSGAFYLKDQLNDSFITTGRYGSEPAEVLRESQPKGFLLCSLAHDQVDLPNGRL